MKIRLFGPVDDVSGYAEIARQIAFNLYYSGVDVAVKPQNWGFTAARPSGEEKLLLTFKTKKEPIDNNLYVNVPSFFQPQPGKVNIGLSMSEADTIPESWAKSCNAMDRILVPSRFNAEAFRKSGVSPKLLRVIPLGINHRLFSPEGPKHREKEACDLFSFLSVGVWTPRKGFDLLIRAFVQEFSAEEKVCLILRCHLSGSNYDPSGQQIRREIQKIAVKENKTKRPLIVLIPRVVPGDEMPALYRGAQCYVAATRGEGWCLPVYEALACGIPVITTNWSGYLDYLNHDNAYLIEVEELETIVPQGLSTDSIYAGRCWARPSVAHLRFLMRYVYENYSEAKNKAERGRSLVNTSLRWDSCVQRICEEFRDLCYL